MACAQHPAVVLRVAFELVPVRVVPQQTLEQCRLPALGLDAPQVSDLGCEGGAVQRRLFQPL